jgi:biotin operon repressor
MNDTKTNNPNYYAIIPAKVRYDKNLTASAKLIYAELTALSNKTGYAYPSNAYLAELYDVSEQSVRNWIICLEDAGYIRREKDAAGNRIIVCLMDSPQKNFGHDQKNLGFPPKKLGSPPQKILARNNTSNNTINNTKSKIEQGIKLPFSEDEFKTAWAQYLKYRKVELRKPYRTARSMNLALDKLKELSNNNVWQAIEILRTCEINGWTGIFRANNKTQNDRSEQFRNAIGEALQNGQFD